MNHQPLHVQRRSGAAPRHGGHRGFTLAELMVVVAIMGVLASLGIAGFRSQMGQSKKTEALAGLRAIAAAQESYRAEHGIYLDLSDDLSTYYPPVVSAEVQHFWGHTGSADWRALAPEIPQLVSFSYATTAGLSGTAPGLVDANIRQQVNWPAPAAVRQPWYVVAACGDTDGDGTRSYFVTASFDSRVQMQDVGE